MNMLRVWGGGIYEDDVFYDLCDELGICVWQDFMFACATYPTFDADFMANVQAEAEDNVRRLRHHACLALWCGNNELEQGLVGRRSGPTDQMSWEDYEQALRRAAARGRAAARPGARLLAVQPAHAAAATASDFNNPTLRRRAPLGRLARPQAVRVVPHLRAPLQQRVRLPVLPRAATTVVATPRREDRNITSYVMEHHQRSGIGNAAIMQLHARLVPPADRLRDDRSGCSQILQGMAMKYAVEHWRRNMPRGMGTLYWQLNDCWPVASWSSIDYFGRWKALHYMARRFYAPLLVSAVEDADKGSCEIWVSSDLPAATEGRIRWDLTDLAGRTVRSGHEDVAIAAEKSRRVTTLRLADEIASKGARDLLLWIDLSQGGKTVSTNLVTFARPKHLELPDPELRAKVRPQKDGSYRRSRSRQSGRPSGSGPIWPGSRPATPIASST